MSTNEVVRRLATDLQQYRFVMKHIDGTSNILANYLTASKTMLQFNKVLPYLLAAILHHYHDPGARTLYRIINIKPAQDRMFRNLLKSLQSTWIRLNLGHLQI